jgi:hypothetical protein
LVLTDCHFGWFPADPFTEAPFYFPPEFHMVPLAAIDHVEFVCEGWTSFARLRVLWNSARPELELFEALLTFPYIWHNAFQAVNVSIVGGEEASLRTFRGFLNNYGMMLWGGTVGFGGLGFLAWTAFTDPVALTKLFMPVTLALGPLMVLPHLLGSCRRLLRQWKDAEDGGSH